MIHQHFPLESFTTRYLPVLLLAFGLTPGPSLAQSAVTSTGPKLGTNLTAVVDYTREWPFVDAFKIARSWISQGVGLPWGSGAPLVLTPDGWPAALVPGQYAETIIYDNYLGTPNDTGSYPTGDYVVLYDGEGKIEFDLGSAMILDESPGRLVVNVPSARYGIYLAITGTNPLNPVRNIRLVSPGYESSFTTNPFHPVFLASLKGYKVLRFMEWMQTNTSTIKSWWDRPLVSDYSYALRGVPLEVMIQLANQTGESPWFNIPHMADDDYVRNFAKTVRDQLDPAIPFYIEYTNETWNNIFSQSNYVKEQGLALGLSTDPVVAGAYYTSLRSQQIFSIFKKTFGNNTQRFVRVIASQAMNPWLQEQTVWFRDAYKNTDALAIAPYFSDCSNEPIGGPGVLGDPSTQAQVDAMTVSQVLDIERQHIQVCSQAVANAGVDVARRYGLKLVAYEGGQGMVGIGAAQSDPTMAALFAAANRDAGMGDLYDIFLQQWKTAGGDLFVHFSDVTSYTNFGNWGSMETQDQDPLTAPKFQALMRYSAANQ